MEFAKTKLSIEQSQAGGTLSLDDFCECDAISCFPSILCTSFVKIDKWMAHFWYLYGFMMITQQIIDAHSCGSQLASCWPSYQCWRVASHSSAMQCMYSDSSKRISIRIHRPFYWLSCKYLAIFVRHSSLMCLAVNSYWLYRCLARLSDYHRSHLTRISLAADMIYQHIHGYPCSVYRLLYSSVRRALFHCLAFVWWRICH